MEAGVMSRYSD